MHQKRVLSPLKHRFLKAVDILESFSLSSCFDFLIRDNETANHIASIIRYSQNNFFTDRDDYLLHNYILFYLRNPQMGRGSVFEAFLDSLQSILEDLISGRLKIFFPSDTQLKQNFLKSSYEQAVNRNKKLQETLESLKKDLSVSKSFQDRMIEEINSYEKDHNKESYEQMSELAYEQIDRRITKKYHPMLADLKNQKLKLESEIDALQTQYASLLEDLHLHRNETVKGSKIESQYRDKFSNLNMEETAKVSSTADDDFIPHILNSRS